MKAWQVTEYGKPIELVDVEKPTPGAGQILVEVHAVGLCHTDVSEYHGDLKQLNPELPFTLGHEIVGVVSELGEGTKSFEIGDRVALPAHMFSPGIYSDGGYAEFVLCKESELITLPDDMGFVQAAPATDAGMTAMHALHVGGVKKGTRVGIIGLGGVGSLGAQEAVGMDAKVYAAEPKEEIWKQAKEWGVKECAKDISDFADKDLEVVVDYAGFGTTTANSLKILGHGGRHVQVGGAIQEATINTEVMVEKELSLWGSQGGTMQDSKDVVKLIHDGKIKPIITTIGFDDIGKGLKDLEDGKIIGRLIATRDNK
jgi:Zn-dependent alcohol dehydrogenases